MAMTRALLILVAACATTSAPPPPPPPVHNAAPLPARTFTSKLHGEKLEHFEQLAASIASPCGRAHSLRTSLERDPACWRTPHALRYLERLVAADLGPDELRKYYDGRYGAAPVHAIDVSRAPLVGGRGASVHMVVFEDLECPHCAALAPIVQQVEQTYGDRLAVHYKMFPLLRPHPHARDAAIAALAADRQGKFLAMTDLIFADQHRVSAADREADARQLGLDVPRFLADIANPDLGAIVDGDIAEADALKLDHVPVVILDGRIYDGVLDREALTDLVAEALEAP